MSNTDVVREAFRAVEARDLERLLDCYHEDVEITESAALPYGGVYRGRVGALAHALAFATAWTPFQGPDEIRMDARFAETEDGLVTVVFRHRARRPQTEERLDHVEVSVYEVRDGKVLRSQMLHDDPGALARFLAGGDFDYEAHGSGYAARRQPDPRIAARLHAALGDARTVVNVGAGAGAYEPEDRHVVAVEPSAAMRAQRPDGLAPAIDATAERLPFDDDSFDAAMATITIHQWNDLDGGLRELRRVSRGPVVILTFDGDALPAFWLSDYVPEVIATDRARFPAIDDVVKVLGGDAEVLEVPIPIDCTDGFGEAYYGRPEAFLESDVRAAQSGWMLTDPDAVARGVERLAADLDSGAWDERYGPLREQAERVGAVRLIVAR